MLISSLIQGDKPAGENWRWVHAPDTWDPLHERRPHFRTLESIALFEPEQRGGLGIEPAPKLLDARIRVAGQMFTWGAVNEGSRLMSFDIPKAKVALGVEHKLSSHVAGTLNPTNYKPLIIDIRSTKPRRLPSTRFLLAVDVAEHPPSSCVSLKVAASDTPFLGGRLCDALKGVP